MKGVGPASGHIMPQPALEHVRPVLRPLEPAIVAAVRHGWKRWRESEFVGVWRCKRSRANFIWEEIIDAAHASIGLDPTVRVLRSQETYKFLVDDRVLFRFKKTDEEGLSANVPTQLAIAFHDHDVDLFGVPEAIRVEVGYKLNRLETDIADVMVIARDGDKILWTYSLLDEEPAALPLPIVQPIAPAPAAKLVRPRSESEESAKSASSE